MLQAITYFEADIPHCSLTYGVAPCTASLTSSPPTGTIKCFNSLNTCQDRTNFTDDPMTLRFAEDVGFLPREIEAFPFIDKWEFTPAIVSLSGDLGQRATLKVTFRNARHSDAGPLFDKYPADRDYADPYVQGTFWGKFRARHPFLRMRACRLIRGLIPEAFAASYAQGDPLPDDLLEQQEIRHYLIDSISGPTPQGEFAIIAKDVLKAADYGVAPALSNGFLVADITDSATSLTLSPSGVGDDEYPLSDYATIGGKEVISFTRDNETKLLLHGDGVDASTTITDSSPIHRTVTANGAAQIDTGQSVFGGSSIQLGVAGNRLTIGDSADFSFGADPFQLDIRTRFSSLIGGAPAAAPSIVGTEVIWKHESAIDPSWYLILSGTAIRFIVINAASTIIGYYTWTHGMVVNTWYRWTLTRNGVSVTLHRDNVLLTATITTNLGATAMPDPTGIMQIGGTTAPGPGWVDEVRALKGVAPAVIAETAAFDLIANGDVLYLTRAQLNTVAVAAQAQDRVQLMLRYVGDDGADILADLWDRAGVVPDFVTLATWQAETAAFLGRVYTLNIAEPTEINKLIAEMLEYMGAATWWDDVNQQIRLQILRAVSTTADRYNEDNVMEGSLDALEQPDKRRSRVIVYFGQVNPTKRIDDTENYRSTETQADAQSETDEGSQAIKIIYARGIAAGGRSVATTLAQKYLSRYVRAPRRFNYGLMQYAGEMPVLGGGYRLGGGTPRVASWPFEDEQGARIDVPIQVTRMHPEGKIEAEEMLFTAFGADIDPNTRTIIIDANENNINLRTRHDELYPEPTSGNVVNCSIVPGVIVGSALTSLRALDIGSWPAGVTINVTNLGRIQGCGGRGGDGSSSGTGVAGSPGGPALYTRYAINLTNTSGEVWAGGGGGGGGGALAPQTGGGGGGAGKLPGAGGAGTAGGGTGSDGSTDAGGAGGTAVSSPGGAGGGPGLAGSTAPSIGGAGGAAGSAIDGVSFCTITGAGDRRGAEIN